MRARFTRRNRQLSPLSRLILEVRVAAVQIDQPAARAKAAREAAAIPVTRVELRASVKGKIAKHARGLMKELPAMTDVAELAEVAAMLRQMADVLASPTYEESGAAYRPRTAARSEVMA